MVGIKLLPNSHEFDAYYAAMKYTNTQNIRKTVSEIQSLTTLIRRSKQLKVLTEKFGDILKDRQMKSTFPNGKIPKFEFVGEPQSTSKDELHGFNVDKMFEDTLPMTIKAFENRLRKCVHGIYVQTSPLVNYKYKWTMGNLDNQESVPVELDGIDGVMRYLQDLYEHNKIEMRDSGGSDDDGPPEQQDSTQKPEANQGWARFKAGAASVARGAAKFVGEKASQAAKYVREKKLRVYIVSITEMYEDETFAGDNVGDGPVMQVPEDDGVIITEALTRRLLQESNGFYWNLLTALIVISVGVWSTFMLLR